MEGGHVVSDKIANGDADRLSNTGGRSSAAAKGRVGSPADRTRATQREAEDDTKMRSQGFGDHKGEDLGRDGKG